MKADALPPPAVAGSFPDGYARDRLCYWKDPQGGWYLNLPGAGLATLRAHDVTEHEDGTITARPSVKLMAGRDHRTVAHGFLTRGIWRDC